MWVIYTVVPRNTEAPSRSGTVVTSPEDAEEIARRAFRQMPQTAQILLDLEEKARITVMRPLIEDRVHRVFLLSQVEGCELEGMSASELSKLLTTTEGCWKILATCDIDAVSSAYSIYPVQDD